jgi:hypothetical protein
MLTNFMKITNKITPAFAFTFKLENKSRIKFNNNSNLIIRFNANKYFFSRTELIRNLEIYLQKLSK